MNEADNPDTSGPHWYCDAVAVDLRVPRVFLCEVSYANGLEALLKRLSEWNASWPALCKALVRDCKVKAGWPVRQWIFIQEGKIKRVVARLKKLENSESGLAMPLPRITTLEMVVPWSYRAWNRPEEKGKPKEIPENMQ
ncbi:MAG: hypothetical protein ACREU3_01275 [Steroidobacteraceae bacterium]